MKRTLLLTLSALLGQGHLRRALRRIHRPPGRRPGEKVTREEAITTYVSGHQIPAKYYQDFGWDAQEIPMK